MYTDAETPVPHYRIKAQRVDPMDTYRGLRVVSHGHIFIYCANITRSYHTDPVIGRYHCADMCVLVKMCIAQNQIITSSRQYCLQPLKNILFHCIISLLLQWEISNIFACTYLFPTTKITHFPLGGGVTTINHLACCLTNSNPDILPAIPTVVNAIIKPAEIKLISCN